MKYSKYELVMKKASVHDSRFDYNITCSKDVYRFATAVMKLHEMPEEHFCVIALSARGNIIGFNEVSKGDLTSSPVHPREVFKAAIIQNAGSICCLHNHPSGDSAPSEADVQTTNRLAEAGLLLGIPLIDHIIVGDDEYVSLKEQGYIL